MRFLEAIDRGEISDLLGRDEYFWLDLTAIGEQEVKELDELFSFHPLALEDLTRRNQRPKLEDYGDYMFVVYYGARPGSGSEVELQEVHAFISGSYIVTSHERSCAALAEARERISATEPRSEQFVVYRVLDALTDSLFPVLDGLDERLEQLDANVFARPQAGQLAEIGSLRRQLLALKRVVGPQRDLLARGVDDILELPGLEADSRNYFRDVYDHAIRISDQIDAYRDLLAGSRDAYLSLTSNRLNEITKQLTVVATIFLPLSFVVGFFGQNFRWMVDNVGSAGAFFGLGIGSLVVSLLVLVVWFRRGSYL